MRDLDTSLIKSEYKSLRKNLKNEIKKSEELLKKNMKELYQVLNN